MKLIRRIDTKVVLYMFNNDTEISLTTELNAGDIRALDINSETHEIVTGIAAPSVFVGGALTFDSEWVVINQDAIDAWVEPLDSIRARIWEDIKKYRDNLVENGGFKVGAHWYHSNLLSRTQYISLVMMGSNIPANTIWKTLDNGYVSMTQTLAGQIFAAGAAQDAALFAKAAEHKAAIDASSTPDSYDWKTGWPGTYQGS